MAEDSIQRHPVKKPSGSGPGHGTSDQTLIRILVNRSEVDLQKVIEENRAMFERTLHEDILNDTKGHYQKVLLALC